LDKNRPSGAILFSKINMVMGIGGILRVIIHQQNVVLVRIVGCITKKIASKKQNISS